MQQMYEAEDVVHHSGNSLPLPEVDDRLKGTKYLCISSQENVHPKRRAEFRIILGCDPMAARAWAIKEDLRHPGSFP